MPDQDHGHDDGDYHPRDAVASATKAVMYSGTAGLIVSGVQNALARENRGLFGVFTKTGTTFGMFGASTLTPLPSPYLSLHSWEQLTIGRLD
ncbi:hypothetical protein Dda_2327 [Drechslerella dactyloides]|uniref:Uncharacterized protein n=1 Tax=Drechslerella dactyloides TaxID=74499 RepID=A0AAD6NLE5_DREDA|nr:hypothetical protein Dda_2327 [Drechslerella dactyloides]